MIESDAVPSAETVRHIDRCLSCLGCRSACPSGVDYPRLIDTSRAHIETHYRRPLRERSLRWFLAHVLTRPAMAQAMLVLAKLSAPFAFLLPGRLRSMARKGASLKLGRTFAAPISPSADAKRVALMPGCVQKALAPEIDEAVARVLARRGIALVPLEGAGCCGSLAHHLGRESEAKAWAERAIEAFERAGEVDAVLITATGCSAHLKDLAHLFAGDEHWAPRAARFAAKAKDFSELATPRTASPAQKLRIASHVPCSQQHGLRITGANEALLAAAGFDVLTIPEGHLCCGSAGTYSILQPELSGRLRARKLDNIAVLAPDAIATTNIGCLEQLSGPDAPPVVHLAELLDWAEGGPKPRALAQL